MARPARRPVLQLHRNPELPRLAWCADYDQVSGRCSVEHGPWVTVEPDVAEPGWLCAAIWDGPFGNGGFNRAEHVFGSGVKIDGDEVHFVTSSTTVDRLFYLRRPDGIVVSNSLVLLLARAGARLAPGFNHRSWGEGICLGRLAFLTDVGVTGNGLELVRQHLYESLVVGPAGIRLVDRAAPHRFTGYLDYVGALNEVLERLWANATDPARGTGARAVSTASRGYDSPAVTALVSKIAPLDCYSAARSNTRIPRPLQRFMDTDLVDDDGSPIAAHLGANPVALSGDLTDLPAELERWLWASAEVSPELIFWKIFADAASSSDLTVWFNGTNGDGVWESAPEDLVLGGTLYRGAPSGVSLAEARLRYGVIDCAVPYLFARDVDSILAITRSAEMAPWRLGNGYDRPIPRRVLEDRGVPRAWFGHGKKMVAQDFESPQGRELQEEFFAATGWNPASVAAYRALNLGVYGANRAYMLARARGSRAEMLAQATWVDKSSIASFSPRLSLRRATFLHCVNGLADELEATSTR